MNNSSHTDFHSRGNPFEDEAHNFPAWVYGLAIGVITLIVIMQ
jgi:hypothetical protein